MPLPARGGKGQPSPPRDCKAEFASRHCLSVHLDQHASGKAACSLPRVFPRALPPSQETGEVRNPVLILRTGTTFNSRA